MKKHLPNEKKDVSVVLVSHVIYFDKKIYIMFCISLLVLTLIFMIFSEHEETQIPITQI